MQRAFTLVEVIIVIGIFSLLIALGLFMSMETLRGTLRRSERDTVVSLLQKARSRAMANVFQTAWSVCYVAPNYIIAKGAVCDAAHAYDSVAANAGVAVASDFSQLPVVFAQLSGDTMSPSDVTIKVVQDSRVSIVSINHEGTITW